MKPEQRGILTMLKEHSARKRFALAVFLIAIVTTVAVFWALRISGLTLEEGDSGSATATNATAEETATGDGTEADGDGDDEGDSGSIDLSTTLTATRALTSTGTGDTYYFADTTTLDTAAASQDESYIVYTIINEKYYVVSADDTLVECEYLGDASDTSDPYDVDSIVDDTVNVGIYCWTDADGNLCFKYTADSGSEDAFGDYQWTLSGTDDDTDTYGTGTYTLYNSTEAVYIAPQDVGISETLTGTSWWGLNGGYYEVGKNYSLYKDSMLVFTVDCTATTGDNGYAAFVVEITDNSESLFLTTTSDNTAWTAGSGVYPDAGDLSPSAGAGSSITAGTSYTVTVSRTDGATYTTYTIVYYDKGGEEVSSLTVDTNIDSAPAYVHLMAQVGTFEISTVYAVSKDEAGTENTSGTTTYNDLICSSAPATITDTDYLRGSTTLKGDFEITYTFYNAGSNSNTTDHYIVGLYDGSDKYVYLWANSSYSESGGSTVASVTKSLEGGSYYPSSSTWRSYMSAGKSTSNTSYTICYVTVSRCKNVITITTVQARKGSGSNDTETTFYYYTTTIIDESFGTDPVTVFLTGQNCTLTGIYTTVSDLDYDVTGYDSYSAIGAWGTTLDLIGLTDGSISVAKATSKLLDYVTFAADSTSAMSFVMSGASNTTFYLARVRSFTAYFDGTNGSVGYYNYYAGTNGANSAYVVTSSSMDPTGTYVYVDMSGVTSTNTGRYSYTANGWYDIYFNKYYVTGTTTIQYEYGENNNCTVLYADWVASEFVGYDSTDTSAENTPVTTLDTSSFISTNVFDYNDLFNLYSAYLDSTSVVSATEHSEVWKFTTSSYGTNNLFGKTALGFVFLNTGGAALTDIDGRGSFAFDSNHTVNGNNTTVNAETAGLLTFANIDSTNLLKYLFDTTGDYAAYNSSTGTGVIGKNYAGTANYLFQYDDDSGYYYFDSARNAAFYDSANSRFYLYDYLVRMIKSTKDTDDSANDFLPFNYGYKTATDADGTKQIVSSSIDYFFGMETDITFYLPDDTGTYDSYAGVYGNQTSEGSDMVFKFMGDDDVWIFVDDELVLDLGGIHDAVYGEINFSTGTVTVVSNTNEYSTGVTYVDQSIDRSDIPISISSAVVSTDNGNGTYTLTYNGTTVGTTISLDKIDAGTHKLTFYYLERGASESNAAIYLNVSSEYKVDLTKVTAGGTSVEGATFDVYNTSSIDNVGDSAYKVQSYTIGTNETVMSISGLVTGNTYYIVESNAPEGYPLSHNIIKVYVSSSGYAEITIYASDKATVLASWTSTDSSFSSGAYLTATPNVTEEIDTDGTIIYSIVFTYSNNLEYELPATGSTGIQPYLMAGEALVLIAGAGLILIAFYQAVRLRRMRAAGNRGYKREKSGNRMRCSGARDRPEDAGRTCSCSGGACNCTGEPYHSSDVVESVRGAYPAHGSLARKRATGSGKRE